MVNYSDKSNHRKLSKKIIFLILLGFVICLIAYGVIKEVYFHQHWTRKMEKSRLVQIGVDSTRVKELLGQPDYRKTDYWSYSEKTFWGPGEIFDVKFREGVVCSTDRYNF